MKKVLIFAVVVALVLSLFTIAAATDAVYDNWKGTFGGRIGTDNRMGGHDYSQATGQVIMNYRKGQKDYVVNMTAEGLRPNFEYVFRVNIGDDPTVRQELGRFTTDEFGNGHMNVRGFSPEIIDFDEYSQVMRFLVLVPSTNTLDHFRVLTTAAVGDGDPIEAVGSNRGE
jgi:hypothetical protein